MHKNRTDKISPIFIYMDGHYRAINFTLHITVVSVNVDFLDV